MQVVSYYNGMRLPAIGVCEEKIYVGGFHIADVLRKRNSRWVIKTTRGGDVISSSSMHNAALIAILSDSRLTEEYRMSMW